MGNTFNEEETQEEKEEKKMMQILLWISLIWLGFTIILAWVWSIVIGIGLLLHIFNL